MGRRGTRRGPVTSSGAVKPKLKHSGRLCRAGLLIAAVLGVSTSCRAVEAKRLVILKVDGMNADLLYRTMSEIDEQSGKSKLPWLTHIFQENGVVFHNFYTRGISLSAPSWSMHDTGQHAVIRGNVEYDRYSGHVYDYLNFFPYYLNIARSRLEDMPGVSVLDRAGIPILLDRYRFPQQFQSFQLFQRGVRWEVLEGALRERFSSKTFLSILENGSGPSLDNLLTEQTEQSLMRSLHSAGVMYLDFYTGDVDHTGHQTNEAEALGASLKVLDSLAGRIWTAIQATPALPTVFVVVSDHGMNNVPGVFSQAFNLPDFFNSVAGGAHHVITNRHQLSDYKLRGLNPLVQRVVTPSTASSYLSGEAARYPTVWLDLDGNERASVHLRNSDWNEVQILLQQISDAKLAAQLRSAARVALHRVVERNRAAWSKTVEDLSIELTALEGRSEERRKELGPQPKWSSAQVAAGDRAQWRRLNDELTDWNREREEYTGYVQHLRALLTLDGTGRDPEWKKIPDYIPELSLGDANSVYQLQNYVAGPASGGLQLSADGSLDEASSFHHVDYFEALAAQRVRNNPQPALDSKPIDFIALQLSPGADDGKDVYWLYGDEDHQILVSVDGSGNISLSPIRGLRQSSGGDVTFTSIDWRAGLPLRLWEDPELRVPPGQDRGAWLSAAHSEGEWFQAIHQCRYSNAVIGITEQFAPVRRFVPGDRNLSPVLLRYERRRRELVQPDFQIFAADHWNFNTRNFNPGGNHGSFLRISTHSVWMMAGAAVPVKTIEQPVDSLNFASTVLTLIGKDPPMPDRVVNWR